MDENDGGGHRGSETSKTMVFSGCSKLLERNRSSESKTSQAKAAEGLIVARFGRNQTGFVETSISIRRPSLPIALLSLIL